MMKDTWFNYFRGELTEEEKQELFLWLETNKEAKQEFSQLNNVWAISQLLTQKQDRQTALEGKRRFAGRMKRKGLQVSVMHLLRYAAVVCFVFLSTWYLATNNAFVDNDIVYTDIYVPSGQRLHITLADGSSVWLSPQSRLKLPNEFKRNNRTIELDGEGFFSITKDEKRPFIVKSKGYNVEVIGTKFNLFSYSKKNGYEAHLVEGKIQVYEDMNKEEAILLLPDEKVSLVNGQLIKSVSPYNNEEFLTNGIYNFQTTPFVDILEHLSLWYDVQFDVKGVVLLTTRVSAKFRLGDDIESILIALQNTFQFNFKRIDDHLIEISQ